MKYWITTHWPPREDNPNLVADGVWVPDRREEAGRDLRKGDLVAVYQSETGRTEVIATADGTEYRVKTIRGRGGVIAIGKVEAPLSAKPESSESIYADGSSIWWRWFSPMQVISKSGFVSRAKLNEILGYSPNYVFHGFGDKRSGLKRIEKSQFIEIQNEFRTSMYSPTEMAVPKSVPHAWGAGIESEDHRQLKEFVASNPAKILGEPALIHRATEYPFCTGDKADIVLEDTYGRIIGVEVEVQVDVQDIAGILQAIKYRYMLELEYQRNMGDSRALLVAYEISESAKRLCSQYGVQTCEVSRTAVLDWATEKGRK